MRRRSPDPDSGRISVLGLDPQRDGAELKHMLGAQLQESSLPDKMRVEEALDLYGSFYRDPADAKRLIDMLGLGPKRKTQYAKLSGGQRQRLSIALALIGRPKVAVLDELTTGLDPQARRDTWELVEEVRGSGVTVILVTHFMDEAERLCDRLALIDSGKVVAIDTPAGLAERVGEEQRVRFRPPRRSTTPCCWICPRSPAWSTPVPRLWCGAAATCCTPSPPCSPASRSSPTNSGSTRPASTTPSWP
ncbi:hypothetical protein GCM10029992_10360 [Glycomyces albus]